MRLYRLAGAAILLLTAQGLGAMGQAPPSIEQALAREGIGLSNSSLLAALNSSKPYVRSTAAVQLAVNKDYDAIPDLIKGLNGEADVNQRMGFALALDLLGEPTGLQVFKQICGDSNLRVDDRVLAAERSLSRGDSGCSPFIIHMLESEDNPSRATGELDYLLDPRLPAETVRSNDRLAGAVIRQFSDGVFGNRYLAARCVSRYQLVTSASALRTALKSESDPRTKAAMNQALTDLTAANEKKAKTP